MVLQTELGQSHQREAQLNGRLVLLEEQALRSQTSAAQQLRDAKRSEQEMGEELVTTEAERQKLQRDRAALERELNALVQEGWGLAQGDVWHTLRGLLSSLKSTLLQLCNDLSEHPQPGGDWELEMPAASDATANNARIQSPQGELDRSDVVMFGLVELFGEASNADELSQVLQERLSAVLDLREETMRQRVERERQRRQEGNVALELEEERIQV